jgi:hypothetical protein
MPAPQQIPWDDMLREFVSAEKRPTAKVLSKKFGGATGTIRSKMSTDKWTQQREQFQKDLAKKTTDKLKNRLAEETAALEAEIKVGHLEMAADMRRLSTVSLKLHIKTLLEAKKPVPLDEARRLAQTATEIERKALGIPEVLSLTESELEEEIRAELAALAELVGGGETEGAPAPKEEAAGDRAQRQDGDSVP